jgi:microsomal dipeptidase-like Zn-dependent dipeptidase
MTTKEPLSVSAPRVPLGGDYWQADPGTPLWGFADLHAHLMAHLAFGGKAFWGQPYDPQHPGPEGLETALSSCEPIHGGLINVNPEFGHPAGGGWPDFIIWPRFTTMVHQQAYIDWLYRAYQGGLRLITCLAVNNELLAMKTSPLLPHDDKSAILAQVTAMKEMAAFVEAQSGGPGKGWLQIAYSPEEARKIIGDNKLAVILGVEVDSLGNWRSLADLEKACHGDHDQARWLIGQELDWLYGLGVRQITPIHLTNNAFGGTAIYMRFLESVTVFLTGEQWTVRDAWDTGVRYRLDHDGEDMVDELERTVAMSGGRKRAMHRRTLIDHLPGIHTLVEAFEAPKLRGGHANARGLNPYGRILLEEMMARGMIIDIDHMSEKAVDAALDLAEEKQYPVICSHTWFRDLLFSAQAEFDPLKQETYETSDVHKVAHEAGKRGDQIERVGRLGGMVAPILNQGDIAGLRRCMPELAAKIPAACAGSSTSWAQAYLYTVAKTGGRGVAIGSDINGAAALPGPRFGASAAFGAHHDARRTTVRRREIEEQTNGVAYRQPIIDHRWHRFETSGPGGYDEEECNLWQAVAQYRAGFNPAIHTHPASDFPELNLREAFEALHVYHHHDWIDHVTEGLWVAEQEESVGNEVLAGWPEEQRAAYFARKEIVDEAGTLMDDHTWKLMVKIQTIWHKWEQMNGNNPPLERSTAGPLRDFDINLDGMAHYGMLPDMLQDIRNSGLTPEDLAPLFRGAYDYVQMWDQCMRKGRDGSSPADTHSV